MLKVDWLGFLACIVPTPEPKLTNLTSVSEILMADSKRTVVNFTVTPQSAAQNDICRISSLSLTKATSYFRGGEGLGK